MRFKFVFLIMSFLLVSILGTTFFLSYLNESERRNLVDRRLQNYFTRLSAINFTDKSDEEIEMIDELGRDLRNAGIVWIWQNDYTKKSGGARAFASLVQELCSVPGFSSGTESQTYIRCLRQPQKKNQPEIVVASILAKGTEPFFLSSRFYWYIVGVVLLGFGFSVFIFSWMMRPFSEFRITTQDFLEQLKSGQYDFSLSSKFIEKRKNRKKYFSDDNNHLIDEYYQFLIQIEKLLSEFNRRSYQLSHEIKTPLTILHNEIYDLQLELGKGESIQLKLKQLKERILDLNSFIQRFEQYSRAELPVLEGDCLFAIDIVELVNKVCADLEHLYPKRITLKIEQTPILRVIADPLDVEHLLLNILTNALKYSEKEVIVIFESDGLQILDQGPGLSNSVKGSLGRPFNRGNSFSSNREVGYGLGISICYALAQKYKWELEFDSSHRGLCCRIKWQMGQSAALRTGLIGRDSLL